MMRVDLNVVSFNLFIETGFLACFVSFFSYKSAYTLIRCTQF